MWIRIRTRKIPLVCPRGFGARRSAHPSSFLGEKKTLWRAANSQHYYESSSTIEVVAKAPQKPKVLGGRFVLD